jgi:hypothetical protein
MLSQCHASGSMLQPAELPGRDLPHALSGQAMSIPDFL